MSKRPQKSVFEYFGKRKKSVDEGGGDDDRDHTASASSSTDSPTPRPSTPNHNIEFDLKLDLNGIEIRFDFIFHFSGTSSNQISIDRGESELPSNSTSDLRIHIAGTSQENGKLHLRVDGNRKCKKKYEQRVCNLNELMHLFSFS
jgi:hypothetical protein